MNPLAHVNAAADGVLQFMGINLYKDLVIYIPATGLASMVSSQQAISKEALVEECGVGKQQSHFGVQGQLSLWKLCITGPPGLRFT